MKVTVKFDESAALKPSEVKVMQLQAERQREINRKWNDCTSIQERAIQQAGMINLGVIWPSKGGAL